MSLVYLIKMKNKNIPEQLTSLLDHKDVKTCLNRSKDIDLVVDKVIDRSYPIFVGNTLVTPYAFGIDNRLLFIPDKRSDLYSVLRSLDKESAIIEINNYINQRPASINLDEIIVGNSRFGHIARFDANQDSHAFGLLIQDHSVLRKKCRNFGEFRKFMIADDEGKVKTDYSIKLADAQDIKHIYSLTDIFDERGIFNFDSRDPNSHFVDPSRADAMYNELYVIAKILDNRIKDEAHHYRELGKEVNKKYKSRFNKELDAKKISSEEDENHRTIFYTNRKNKGYYTERERLKSSGKKVEKGISKKIDVLEARVLTPDFIGKYGIFGLDKDGNVSEYSSIPNDKDDLKNIFRYCVVRSNELSYTIGPRIRIDSKATELAFKENSCNSIIGDNNKTVYNEKNKPDWAVWHDEKIVRTDFRVFRLARDFKLAYRLMRKTLQVSPNYGSLGQRNAV